MRQIIWLFAGTLWIHSFLSDPLTVQADYEQLVAAEQAFAQQALEQGIQKAFVENLDEQSVIFFNNHFLPGKSTYQQLLDSQGKLTWRPTYAEISASGTMGYTTGPFEFRPHSMNEEPVSFGQFTSVWHKTATGQWKALLDFGCTYGKPEQPEVSLVRPTQFATKVVEVVDTAVVSRELKQTEVAFAQTARTQSLQGAYQFVLPASDSIRLLREGSLVYAGSAARTMAEASHQKVDYQLVRVMASSAGDFGVSYGYVTFNQSRQGYIRIWRKRQGAWQLAHEVLGVKLS
ncbi:hypothetical protein GO730_35100 [Spirosoma sp. HMF3257]|uniref:Nuclear transport factor 2 family protein n=1 Tax=Spirosoma telluris TaxID=2183553 RepID=A0A327NRY2_9BACT|nr:hypothetical protein [Spirosoma telluris]RAI78007.1 hypothetical protein HMF3257_34995 [Spirosoma telluris]